MENASVSLQVGVFIWGFAMLIMAMVVCAANRKLWIDRMNEKCGEFQKQYDDLVKALDKDKEAFEEEKKALAEKYKHVELENAALKSKMRNYPDTIRWYQNILSWYTKIDGEKINGFINEEVNRFNFSDKTD